MPFDPEIFSGQFPVLGICYGMQLVVHFFGGHVERSSVREDGVMDVFCEPYDRIGSEDDILADVAMSVSSPLSPNQQSKSSFEALLTHGDCCTDVPESLVVLARDAGGVVMALRHKNLPIYGVQFHPEVDLTPDGGKIFKRFAENICGARAEFSVENRIPGLLKDIKTRVGDRKVVVLLSGGVDSSVCGVLVHRAIGTDRVLCVHIDTGFMRKGESELVVTALRDLAGINTHVVNARDTFLDAITPEGQLRNTVGPEPKRRSIGDTFINVVRSYVVSLGLENVMFVQGTLRPDLIESGGPLVSMSAAMIKTHHNDSPMARQLREMGDLLEPLADLHKDEVRILGRALGMKSELIDRQPFPGPGLAIRLLCANRGMMSATWEQSLSELEQLFHGLGISLFSPSHLQEVVKSLRSTVDNFAQARWLVEQCGLRFTLLPVRSVGVQGDARSYSHVVALSCSRVATTPLAAWRVNFNDTLGLRSGPPSAASSPVLLSTIPSPSSPAAASTSASDASAVLQKTLPASDAAAGPSDCPFVFRAAEVPWRELFAFARMLTALVSGLNRVVLVMGAPLESTQIAVQTVTTLGGPGAAVEVLREADAAANAILQRHGAIARIAQTPVVLIPVDLNARAVPAPTGFRAVPTRSTPAAGVPGGAAVPAENSATAVSKNVESAGPAEPLSPSSSVVAVTDPAPLVPVPDIVVVTPPRSPALPRLTVTTATDEDPRPTAASGGSGSGGSTGLSPGTSSPHTSPLRKPWQCVLMREALPVAGLSPDVDVHSPFLTPTVAFAASPPVFIDCVPGNARAVVIRPFVTRDFMTGRPGKPGPDDNPLTEISFSCLDEIATEIGAIPGVSRVLYDLTAKPPGTTEWE